MVSGGRYAELFDDVVKSVVGDAQVARRIDSSDREVVEENYFDLGAIYRYLFARRWLCSKSACTTAVRFVFLLRKEMLMLTWALLISYLVIQAHSL